MDRENGNDAPGAAPDRRRPGHFLAICVLPLLGLAVLVAVGLTLLRLHPIPPEHLPFGRLDLTRPIGLATGFQLARLRADPSMCRGVLDMSALEIRPIPSRRSGPFCGLLNAVELQRSTVPYSAPVRVTCPMAAALYLWEREVVGPAAERHLGSKLAGIDHLGTYSCRRIGGGPAGRPSEHATANAIDVAGFRLEDGRRITLAGDWSDGAEPERAFLREIRAGACDLFRVVLGPDYNAAHRDHFHLDMGAFRACR
ncbi:MAG: extensin family protein [Thalassobaculum sp.]|uniref:extensin-like domain-containing protein n=1 Tax=Thalassobaculum sp. TaxID=2022740 RepID=UPI0032EFB26A